MSPAINVNSNNTVYSSYAVLYKKTSSDTWTTKQSYSTNKTVTFKPAAAVNYDICVKVRDNSNAVVQKNFTVKVTK